MLDGPKPRSCARLYSTQNPDLAPEPDLGPVRPPFRNCNRCPDNGASPKLSRTSTRAKSPARGRRVPPEKLQGDFAVRKRQRPPAYDLRSFVALSEDCDNTIGLCGAQRV